MLIRELKLEELERLYYHYMKEDFPASELKSFKTIADSYKASKYTCFVMEDKEDLVAYACFVWLNPEVKILDYFAVNKKIRQRGYGSKMLTWMKENPNIKELIVESEDPEYSDSASEARIRNKRLNFYEKNGFKKRELKVSLGGVAFNLFTLRDTLSEENLLKEITDIYHFTSRELKVNPY